jgi:hypothetical protein
MKKRYQWRIVNERNGDSVIYNALHNFPVTKEHALSSPSVRRWAGNDPVRAEEIKN